MKKFSIKCLVAALAAAIMLTSCIAVFGAAADVQPAAEAGATETEALGAPGGEIETEYTPISDSLTTSPHSGDYYSVAADMNHDMVLNSADARFILRLAAKIEWVKTPRYLPAGMIFGDIDENGRVNAADGRWALRVAAKLNTVQEVIEQAAKMPVPTTTEAPTTEAPSSEPTAAPTTAAPTTNPLELTEPLCEEFYLKLKATDGTVYVVACDGVNCYIKSNDLLKGFGVLVDREGSIYVINDENKEYTQFGAAFSQKILGFSAQSVRDFVKAIAVPEFNVFEDCKLTEETIKDIPYTVASRRGAKFYFFADGTLAKITAKNLKDKSVDFSITKYSDDAASTVAIPEEYKSQNSNVFILKYGIDFLTNKF